MSESELKKISRDIDKIIKYQIKDETTISCIFDALLNINLVEKIKKW